MDPSVRSPRLFDMDLGGYFLSLRLHDSISSKLLLYGQWTGFGRTANGATA